MRDSLMLAIAAYASGLCVWYVVSLLLPGGRERPRAVGPLILLEVLLVVQAAAHVSLLVPSGVDAPSSRSMLGAYLVASVTLLPLLMRGQPRTGATPALVGSAACAAVVVVILRLAVLT